MKKSLLSLIVCTLLASSHVYADGFPAAPGVPAPAQQPSSKMDQMVTQQQQQQQQQQQLATNPAQTATTAPVAAQAPSTQAGAPFNPAAASTVNGVKDLPPLTPPADDQISQQGAQTSSAYGQAAGMVTSMSPEDVRQLRTLLDKMQRAKSYTPVRAIPKISSMTVNMSAGSSMPILRVMAGQLSTLIFEDETGAPWPIVKPPKASSDLFAAEWNGSDAPSVTVWANTAYGEGNLVVFLKGLANPVIVQLSAGEPDSKATTRVVDARLNLRIPMRGPFAKTTAVISTEKIGLYDDTLQQFLDGVPPKEAKRLTLNPSPNGTSVWRLGDSLFVRTPLDTQTIFSKTLASSDGVHVYQMDISPFITLSDEGKSVTVQVGI